MKYLTLLFACIGLGAATAWGIDKSFGLTPGEGTAVRWAVALLGVLIACIWTLNDEEPL